MPMARNEIMIKLLLKPKPLIMKPPINGPVM